MSILSDQIVMSEKVLRGERDQRLESGDSKMNGYYAEGNKYPDNRQTIDGGGTVGKDGFGEETINDSKVGGFIANPAFVGVITQHLGYEEIIDHHQMYIDGEWKNEGTYGV